ncbi:hypothetical protein PAMA111031_04135 [Paraphotobacterium marinum]
MKSNLQAMLIIAFIILVFFESTLIKEIASEFGTLCSNTSIFFKISTIFFGVTKVIISIKNIKFLCCI